MSDRNKIREARSFISILCKSFVGVEIFRILEDQRDFFGKFSARPGRSVQEEDSASVEELLKSSCPVTRPHFTELVIRLYELRDFMLF